MQKLITEEGRNLPEIPWNRYPRPMLRREKWLCLNGEWDFRAEGMPKGKTFWYGVLSGAVEPAAAIVTILASGLISPLLPYMLAFAAGAMFYVVVEELIPEMSEGQHSNLGTIAFSFGFVLMMILDVALG